MFGGAQGSWMHAAFWSGLFEHAERQPGASEEQIQQFLQSISRRFSQWEADRFIRFFQRNPFPPSDSRHHTYVPPDPSTWNFPSRGVPNSYLDFLRWSNGGIFRNGERVFEFYPCEGVRSYLITYYTPAFTPYLVPFASDQAERGNWYGFDTRSDPVNGEFPILFGQWNSLGDDYVLAETFLDLCRGTTDPEVLYWDAWRKKQRQKAIAELRARSEQRFGPLPLEALQKLEQKSLPELSAMIRAFEQAKSLQEVGL